MRVSTRVVSDRFQQGIDLFNEGRYFECHEVWEEVWLRSVGEEKLFLQGLIQAAVAILHAERGNLDGAASLYEKSLAKLAVLPAEYMGVALGELRAALARFFAAVLAARSAALPPRPHLRRT
jgi:hypothetical protein